MTSMATVIGGDDDLLVVTVTGWTLVENDTARCDFRQRPDGPVIGTALAAVDVAANTLSFNIGKDLDWYPTGHLHHTVVVEPAQNVNGPYTVASGWLRSSKFSARPEIPT